MFKKKQNRKKLVEKLFFKGDYIFFKDQQFKQKQNKYILTQNFKGKWQKRYTIKPQTSLMTYFVAFVAAYLNYK